MDVTTTPFDPTRPPARRLVRLGVVLDGRTPGVALPSLVRMCERAGIDIVWVADPLNGTAMVGEIDALSVAAGMLRTVTTASVGAMVDGRRAIHEVVDLVGSALQGAPAAAQGFEICAIGHGRHGADVLALHDGLSSISVGARCSAIASSGQGLGELLGVADDIVLSAWQSPDLETAADDARLAALTAGRDPASLGVAALLPVSVGRTDAEANARSQMDPDFARFGHPAEIGIFGTLEDCQDRVIALAHAGITDLRCVLPATPDIHDVIAQLTAMTIGTVDVLVPGSLRSPAPPPPEGWGGRPDRPPLPRTSAGSRRRG